MGIAVAPPPPPAHAGSSPPEWSFTSTDEVVFFQPTPPGILVVSTSGGLYGVEPESGRPAWTRDDIRNLPASRFETLPGSSFALLVPAKASSREPEPCELLDVETGRTQWTSTAIAGSSIRGHVYVPERRLLVVWTAPRAESDATWKRTPRARREAQAIDVGSGTVLWRTDTLFHEAFETFPARRGGASSARRVLNGHQPPILDTDSTMVLLWSRDGVIRVHLGSGSKLWTAPLHARTVPSLAAGYAPMLLDAGVLYVPAVRRLQALSVADGRMLWSNPAEHRSKIVQMQMTRAGLLVRGSPSYDEKGKIVIAGSSSDFGAWSDRARANTGKPFLDLLDPRTGLSRWKRPVSLHKLATSFALRGDTIYVGDHGKLLAIQLEDGSVRKLAAVSFEGNEKTRALETRSGGVLLGSSQNLTLVASDGRLVYHAYFAAPRASGWAIAGGSLLTVTSLGISAAIFVVSTVFTADPAAMAWGIPAGADPTLVPVYVSPLLWKRYKASRSGLDYVLMLTNARDEAGNQGPGLVQVDKDTGRVLKRVVLGDRTPEMQLDAIEGRLYFKRTPERIDCFKF